MELKGAILVWFSTRASYKRKTLTKNKCKEEKKIHSHMNKNNGSTTLTNFLIGDKHHYLQLEHPTHQKNN
jgi:hypothetical protein